MGPYNAGVGHAQVAAAGAQQLATTITTRDQVQAANAKYKLQKNLADAQNTPDNINAKIDAVKAENEALINKFAKEDTYKALQTYTYDGNPNVLTSLVQQNSRVRQLMGNVAGFARIDPETDTALLNQAGIKPEDFNQFRFIKAINPDGSQHLVDMQGVMLGTGYLSPSSGLTRDQLDFLTKERGLFGSSKPDAKPGPLERDAKYLATQGQGSESDIAGRLYQERIAGNDPGKMQLADQATADLESAFGGQDGYLQTNFSDIKNRMKAEPYIRRLEKYSGVKLTSKDRTDIKDLNNLVAMADLTSAKLTPKVTGAMDSLLRTAKTYISNSVADIDQVQAQSAYAAFRNTVRHALFGSALTPGEMQSFNEAFGTLKQKYPAVVTQFKTALADTKSRLETIARLNNPYLAHYYMGKSAEQVDEIIARLDERINMIDSAEQQHGAPLIGDTQSAIDQHKPAIIDVNPPADPTTTLDSIFGPK